MLQSILNDDVEYLLNKKVAKNDIGNEVSVYDVELFDVNVAICIGEIIDTFIDKLIYYCPVYLIIKKLNVERIGYFEFYKQELKTITDKGGDIDISLLEGPLLFDYVDSDYLVNKVSKGQFINKFILEDEEFTKLQLVKTKKKELGDKSSEAADAVSSEAADTVSSEAADTVSSEAAEGETKASAAASAAVIKTVGRSDKTSTEQIYDDVNSIPDINKIKLNGEKKINEELLLSSKKTYLEDIKSYKGGGNEFWIQEFYNNNHFSIQDVENNGDCFFATLREAFKTFDVVINVSTIRNILSRKVSQEDYTFNKTIFADTVKTLKGYQKKYKVVKENILKKTNEKKTLLKIALAKKDDRSETKRNGTRMDKINKELIVLETEKNRLSKAFGLSNDIYKGKQFMKRVKSFEDYLKVINSTEYWADELAISLLEFLFNIKVIIISEDRFDDGESNILSCGTTILMPIEKRGEFNPKFYIMVNHTGNHYKLIKYKNKAMLDFYELPDVIKENIKKNCSKSLFKFIPLFKAYFAK